MYVRIVYEYIRKVLSKRLDIRSFEKRRNIDKGGLWYLTNIKIYTYKYMFNKKNKI